MLRIASRRLLNRRFFCSGDATKKLKLKKQNFDIPNLTVSTFVRPKKEAQVESILEIPTTKISGLNFSPAEQEKYYQNQKERKLSVGAHSPQKEPEFIRRAKSIAAQLGIPLVDDLAAANLNHDFILSLATRIQLRPVEKPPHFMRSGPIYCDFFEGEGDARRRQGGFNPSSPIIKACKIQGKISGVKVVDATGGLGVDAFVLASMGFDVTVLERDPFIYTLLRDGYERGKQHKNLVEILGRMKIVHIDSMNYFRNLDPAEIPDVVYLDPMYPNKEKAKSLPKKEMMIARRFLPRQDPIDELVTFMRQHSKSKVVLKRPQVEDPHPDAHNVYKGRTTNFEVFLSTRPGTPVADE